jgi:predicted negative regulator of RcsB-dependent stress response
MTMEEIKNFIRLNKKGLIVGAIAALALRALIR